MKKHWRVLPNEPRWVPIEEVISAAQEAVKQTDEPFQLRDRGLLESALVSCQNHHFYAGEQDVVVLAVQMLIAIARNHPFAQGNKRTAFTSALMFIETNGFVCDYQGTKELADLVVAVIEGKTGSGRLVLEFKRFTRRSVSRTTADHLSQVAEGRS